MNFIILKKVQGRNSCIKTNFFKVQKRKTKSIQNLRTNTIYLPKNKIKNLVSIFCKVVSHTKMGRMFWLAQLLNYTFSRRDR
jgi:c-di-GMP-related signal transduction protein